MPANICGKYIWPIIKKQIVCIVTIKEISMVKHLRFGRILSACCSLNSCCSNRQYPENKKEVIAIVEEVPNYIFHLLTLGKIVPEDNEYISLYGDSITIEDQTYLYEHRNLLAWGDGNIGPITHFFLFIPGYIGFQSQAKFNEYFDLLSNVLENDGIDIFIEKYDSYFKKIEIMFGPLDMRSYFQPIMQYASEVSAIGRIYKNNFGSYLLNVWPREKEKLDKAAGVINSELQKLDLISQWEKLTKLKFKTNEYQIVLFTGNKNGPNANSLGYDRNTFYYDLSPHVLVQLISHEVGTHILIDDFSRVAKIGRFEYSDVYMAYENLAEFYTVKFIYGEKPLIGYDVETYYQIFTGIYNSNKKISSVDLLIKGLEVYKGRNKSA